MTYRQTVSFSPFQECCPNRWLLNQLKQTEITPSPNLLHSLNSCIEATFFYRLSDRVSGWIVYYAAVRLLLEEGS